MFDLTKFERADFEAREADVRLPALAPFFAEDAEPVFRVRGLTAAELATAEESANRGKLVSDLVEKLLEKTGSKQKADAILEAAGLGPDTEVPKAVKQRMEHVRMGVIEPELSLQHVVKLATVAPIEFTKLANTILELTGQGQTASVKPAPSGKEAT